MAEFIPVIDVIVPTAPVIDVAAIGVQGPPGEDGAPGPPGPAGPQGPAGTAGIHAATHYVGGADALAGSLAATDVRVGVNPAQTGAVRLANNQPIVSRNSGNTGDIRLLKVDAGDAVSVGAGTGALSFDAQNVYVNGRLIMYFPAKIELAESGPPAVPGATIGVVYMDNNGAGKSRLMIQFQAGPPVQIAIQP
jgi:hypothetical protein